VGNGRALVFVTGLAVGIVIGVLWSRATRDAPARTPRGGHTPDVDVVLVARDTVVIQPRRTVTQEGNEFGWLEVDFTGFPGRAAVRIEGTTMHGQRDYAEHGSDSTDRVRVELAPGIHVVTWEGAGGMNRYRARVRIDAGRVTFVRATDEALGVNDAEHGLAVVTVAVLDRDGRRRSGVLVRTRGASFDIEEEWEQRTDERGNCRFRLRSGSYVVGVGAVERPVRLAERADVEFRSGEGYGEVPVSPALPGAYRLRPKDGRELRPNVQGPSAIGFVFVTPGRYALTYRYRGPRSEADPPDGFMPDELVVAELDVRGGTATVVPHTAAPGVIEVRVTRPTDDAPSELIEAIITPLDSDRATRRQLTRRVDVNGRATFVAKVGPLDPGWHKMEIVARDRAWLRYALVGFGRTTVTVAFEEIRGRIR